MTEADQPIRVVLVEDHEFYRSGLKQMLGEEGIHVVGDVGQGEDGVALVKHARPDVVLMDVNMEGLSGIEATRRVMEAAPDTRVIMLTISADDADLFDSLVAGACGYLLKDASVEEMVTAVRKAADGDSPLSPAVAGRVIAHLRDHAAATPRPGPADPALSGREREILALVGEGLDNSQIAARLNLSPTTVKHHVSNLLEKLGVENRVQAAVYAVRRGLA